MTKRAKGSVSPIVIPATVGVLRGIRAWERSIEEFFRLNELAYDRSNLPKAPEHFPVFASFLYVGPPVDRFFADVFTPSDALLLLKGAQKVASSIDAVSDLFAETAIVQLLVEGELCTEERAVALFREVAAGREGQSLRKRLKRALADEP
jgi:hypothetical protein